MKRPTLLIVAAIAATAVLLVSLGTWLWSVVDVEMVLTTICLGLGWLARKRFRIISFILLLRAFLGFWLILDRHWPSQSFDPPAASAPTAQPTNTLEIPSKD